MPRIITLEDDAVISLEECCAELTASGFAPDDDESLHPCRAATSPARQ